MHSDSFLVLMFYSFCHVSFPASHYLRGAFFYFEFHPYCETLPPLPPHYLSQSSNHVFFFAGRWSTSGWGGNAHFFTYTQEYDRGRQEKIERQTKKTKLGVTKGRGRCCNTTCICGLSLAWVTSENSTMLLESDILRLFFTGPYLVSSFCCSPPLVQSQLPTVSLWVASSTLIRLPVPLPGTARFHVQESFVWFRAKTDNWIVCFGSLPP